MTMPDQEQATRPAKRELTAAKYYDELSAWYARQSPQDVAGYNALGGTDTEACANCMFFMSPNQCTVVESWPVAISPTGRSKFWTAIPEYRPEPMEVIIVDRPAEEKAAETGFLGRAWGAVKALWESEQNGRTPEFDRTKPSGFQVYKDKNGQLQWFGWVSNKWLDRDGEIIEDAAHKEFVEYLDRTKDFPELQTWHTKGTRYGVANWADYADGFMMMAGPIDDNPAAIKAAMALEGRDMAMSHGFIQAYSDKRKGIIGWYRDGEVSSLPPAAAANVWTQMGVSQEEGSMGFRADKRAHLVEVWGEDRVAVLERDTKQRKDALEASGIDFKEVWEDDPATPPVVNNAGPSLKEISDAVTKAIGDSPAVKAIADSVTGLGSAVEQLTAGQKSLDERLKAVERTDAEKTASFFAARATPGAGLTRPSESAKTAMTEEEKAAASKAAPDAAFAWLEGALPTR